MMSRGGEVTVIFKIVQLLPKHRHGNRRLRQQFAAIVVASLVLSVSSGDTDDFPVATNFGSFYGSRYCSIIGLPPPSILQSSGRVPVRSFPPPEIRPRSGREGRIWTRAVGGSVTTSHAWLVIQAPLRSCSIDTPAVIVVCGCLQRAAGTCEITNSAVPTYDFIFVSGTLA